MKRLLFIALLVVFGCEDKEQEKVYGCTDPTACNFNPEATEDNGTCTIAIANWDCDGNCNVDLDCNDECGGEAVEDNCGVCDSDSTNDCCMYLPSGLDFGLCQAIIGFVWYGSECTLLSGCGTNTEEGIDYSSYFFDTIEECEQACY